MGVNSKPEKLLDRYNLSIVCLDYTYITNCNNQTEVENILSVLRSGEEGIFPDLIRFCENRLRELCPNNELLLVQKSLASAKDLPLDEQQSIQEDLKIWENQMQQHNKDQGLSECKENDVPIRITSQIQHKDEVKGDGNKQRSSTNAFRRDLKKLRSFGEWNKFDVEQELEKINTDTKVVLAKTISEKKQCPKLEPYVSTTALSAEQKLVVAERERIKGNEAFKAGDLVEAGVYYSRSLSTTVTIAALNNRALTNFKLKNFTAALVDCNMVLDIESDNIKALYRRGLVYKDTSRPQLAYMDFSSALELDPDNKAAQEQLNKIEKTQFSLPSEKDSVVIEEITDGCQKDKTIDNPTLLTEAPVKDSLPKINQLLNAPKEETHKLSSNTRDFLNVCGKGLGVKRMNSNQPLLTIREQHPIQKSAANSNENDKATGKHKEFVIDIKPLYKVDTNLVKDMNIEEKDKMSHIGITSNTSDGKAKEANITDNDNISTSLDDFAMVKNITHKETIPFHQPLEDNKSITISSEIITPFRFISLWHSTKANDNPECGAIILRNLDPVKLSQLLSEKLDGDLLMAITRAIVIIASTEPVRGYKLMQSLASSSRIATVFIFLSDDEKKEIRNLCLMFKESGMDNDHWLQTMFCSK